MDETRTRYFGTLTDVLLAWHSSSVLRRVLGRGSKCASPILTMLPRRPSGRGRRSPARARSRPWVSIGLFAPSDAELEYQPAVAIKNDPLKTFEWEVRFIAETRTGLLPVRLTPA